MLNDIPILKNFFFKIIFQESEKTVSVYVGVNNHDPLLPQNDKTARSLRYRYDLDNV